MVLFDLLVHVLRGHDGHHREEEGHNAERSQEVEFTLDEADHRSTALVVEATEPVTLVVYRHTNVNLPNGSDLGLVASEGERIGGVLCVLACTAEVFVEVLVEVGHHLIAFFFELLLEDL